MLNVEQLQPKPSQLLIVLYHVLRMCFPGVIRLFCLLDKTQQKLIVPKPAHCHNMFKQNFGAEFRELLRSQRHVMSALFWAPDQRGHQNEVHRPRRVRQL